jgi:hypothetical protein
MRGALFLNTGQKAEGRGQKAEGRKKYSHYMHTALKQKPATFLPVCRFLLFIMIAQNSLSHLCLLPFSAS